MSIDLLFLTHNRLAFTIESFEALIANTDWRNIEKLYLFDDRSEDGTYEYLDERAFDARESLPEAGLVRGSWGSPIGAMADFIRRSSADYIIKIDSDVMLPRGWVVDCLDVMRTFPRLDVLGIEARGTSSKDASPHGVRRGFTKSDWIGGIGIMRRSIFRDSRPEPEAPGAKKYFGWQAWQMQHKDKIRVGWMNPSMEVFLLDRLPMEPWRGLSDLYFEKGWQRAAPYRYGHEWAGLWHWWEPKMKEGRAS